jgi:hypothetical protein
VISNRWKILAAALPIIGTLAIAQPQPGGLGGFYQAWYGGIPSALPDIPTDGLVSWWRPGATLGDDDQVGAYNLTRTNVEPATVLGYKTDGSNDTAQAVFADYTIDHYHTNLTIGMLIRRDALPTTGIVESFADRSAGAVVDGWTLENVRSIGTNHIRFVTRGNGIYAIATGNSAPVGTTGVWFHAAGVYDGAVAYVYVNGVEVDNTAGVHVISNAQQGITFSARHPVAGFFENNNVTSINGYFDEMTYYNRALSSAEIQQLADELLLRKQ